MWAADSIRTCPRVLAGRRGEDKRGVEPELAGGRMTRKVEDLREAMSGLVDVDEEGPASDEPSEDAEGETLSAVLVVEDCLDGVVGSLDRLGLDGSDGSSFTTTSGTSTGRLFSFAVSRAGGPLDDTAVTSLICLSSEAVGA